MPDRNRIRTLGLFFATFIVLQMGWEQCRGTAFERLVIDQATVTPAAQLLQWLWPTQIVRAEGHSLVSAYVRLNVLNGCEGLETLFLLAAAFVAFPLPWSIRAVGLSLGALLVYVLNEGRIILLWHIIAQRPDWFGALHGTVLPLVLIAVIVLFFSAFLSLATPKQP